VSSTSTTPASGLANGRTTDDAPNFAFSSRLGSGMIIMDPIVANCLEIIHADIVGVWNLPDEDRVRRFFLSGLSFLLKKNQ
jgi:hypothetical protein